MGNFLKWARSSMAGIAHVLPLRSLTTKCGDDQKSASSGFKCYFCQEVFESRNGMFKHLRLEHPSAHNRRCDKCQTFPVKGRCYERYDKPMVLCGKCFELSEQDPDFCAKTFSRLDRPNHMLKDIQAQPKRVHKAKALLPDPLESNEAMKGPTLKFPASCKLPKSLVDVFDKYASAEPPTFRIPSKMLREEVPSEDLEFAWRNGLLRGMPIGLKSTFAHEEKEQWLNLAAKDPDRDVALSPLEPEVTPKLLLAILRFQNFRKEIDCKHVRLIAKSTWDCGNPIQDWQLCAEKTPGVKIDRRRGSFGHKSASIALCTKSVVQPLDFEEFTFAFLQRVNGEEFYSTPSLAESLYRYGQQPEHSMVPLDVCYELIWRARQSGCINPCTDGRQHLVVELDPVASGDCPQDVAADEVSVFGLKGTNSQKNTGEAAENETAEMAQNDVAENETDFGKYRVWKLRLSEVLPTRASGGLDQAASCQRKFGGCFAREICRHHERRQCSFGSDCNYIHRVKEQQEGGPRDLCEKLSDDNCRVRDLDLREVLWESMKTGHLRISLETLLERWSTESNASREALLLKLQEEVRDGNLTILVAAASAQLACEWHERVVSDLQAAAAVPEIRIFLAPVLTQPPLQLLECLDEYCQKELLVMKVAYLRLLCKSCFGLVISSSSWVELAKKSGFRHNKNGQDKGHWILRKSNEKRRCEWKAQSDTTQRREDLIGFMGGSLEEWPSVGVFLESARIFGAPSLQPAPGRRSRLAALYGILEELTGDMLSQDVDSEEEDLVWCDEQEDFLDSQGPTRCSSAFPDMDWHLFPPPIMLQATTTWPAPPSAVQKVSLLSGECDPQKVAGTVVRGKRVLTRTRAYSYLSTMLNRLMYGHSSLVDGSWITDASTATDLLQSAGYDEAVVKEWIGGSDSISSDLLIAMVLAKWRRFNDRRNSGAAPDAQEILGGLLLAQALSHGQGRSHRLRKPIVGLLWRHPRLRGKMPMVCRGGSVGMGMDTSRSDHDVFLQWKDGEEDMVQILYEVLLDLKKSGSHDRLKRAKIIPKDFAVEVQDYYRNRDFDLVPYTQKSGKECQWDAARKVWQPILHKDLAPKLQELSETDPFGFLMTRLLKIYNESLKPLRRSGDKEKVPLISLHILLMVLGARDQDKLKSCKDPQSYFLESLRFIKDNWSRGEVASAETSLKEIGAEAHLQRMTGKYRDAGMEEEFNALLHEHLMMMEQLCQETGHHRADAERIVQRVRLLFGSRGAVPGLLAPEPAFRLKGESQASKL